MKNFNIYNKRCRCGPLILILFLVLNCLIVLDGSSADEVKTSKKITLDYKDADLATVLRSFFWTYDLNIVTGPKVRGKVTISLKNVEVREALDVILTVSGFVSSERNGIIYVVAGDSEAVDMDSEVIFLKYITASEVLNLLRDVGSDKGSIKINEVSNSLVITDFPKSIAKIKELLDKVDIAPKQVLIEAKIVDVTSSDLAATGTTTTSDYNSGHGLYDCSTWFLERLTATIDMSENSDLNGGQMNITAFTMNNFSIPMTIDALVKDGKAKLLASPSIAVLNGGEARIIIGERYPISERTQTTTGTTEIVNSVDTGTNLSVTPVINDDGYITMRIHSEVSSSTETVGNNPRIVTREADITVRIKEGETLIIGGLIKNTDNETHEKVPFLGDVPILGALFRPSSKTEEQAELAVFITPKILRSLEEKKRLGRKSSDKENVYNALEITGNLVLVESLFDRARSLDRGVGIESVRKSKAFRKTQALSIYKHIAIEFPGSDRAAEAIYRAGMIHYKDLKEHELAKEVLTVLISDYPKSKFVVEAKSICKKVFLTTKDIKNPRPIGLDILKGN